MGGIRAVGGSSRCVQLPPVRPLSRVLSRAYYIVKPPPRDSWGRGEAFVVAGQASGHGGGWGDTFRSECERYFPPPPAGWGWRIRKTKNLDMPSMAPAAFRGGRGGGERESQVALRAPSSCLLHCVTYCCAQNTTIRHRRWIELGVVRPPFLLIAAGIWGGPAEAKRSFACFR
jgi:hypothetical protein